MWINTKQDYYLQERPTRIRLSDGSTRTNDAITDELLFELGWVFKEFLEESGESTRSPANWFIDNNK